MSAAEHLRTLETTADDAQRNGLALSLAEEKTPGLDAVLVRLIQRPDLVEKRGALVHALGYLDCSNHVGLLVRLVLTGGFEVAHEALQALETVEEADGDDIEEAFDLFQKVQADPTLPPWRRELIEDLAEMFD